MADDKRAPRKEKVIHARVSESLDEQLKLRAEQLGVSVSNLVRNLLQHTMGLVGDIVVDGARIARSARGEVPTVQPPSPPEPPPVVASPVVGWQEAVLNLNAVCEQCNALLPVGSRAAIGITDAQRKPVLCRACLEELTDERSDPTRTDHDDDDDGRVAR